jgi:DNA helicase-2/ATP-dependent DNA helicase PcrA
MTDVQWSAMQQAVFDAVGDDHGGNLVVEALAGSGKTTTIVEAVNRTYEDESALVVAFNKGIADEFRRRGLPSTANACTLHSFGFSQLRRQNRDIHLNDGYVREYVSELVGGDKKNYDTRVEMARLVSAAKNTLWGGTIDTLDMLADRMQIEVPETYDRLLFMQQTSSIIDECARKGDGQNGIDFDDMIWLPIVRNIPLAKYDWAFVDEAQDLNPPQLAMVLKVGRRTVAVGDRHQAIYAFRGADSRALTKVRDRLEASTLPLSVTYRCPLAVVREAQLIVSALQARPDAPEGKVREAGYESALRDSRPGDVILSRSNAPLITMFYGMVGLGKKALIKGKDIGKGLATWVRRTHAKDMGQLRQCIELWREAETTRLVAADRPFDHVTEKANCLLAVARHHSDVKELCRALEVMFSDADYSESTHIVLSSTHRAKGLEWPRVWLLRDTYLKFPGEQEKNLLYVAITRCKNELIYCNKEADE